MASSGMGLAAGERPSLFRGRTLFWTPIPFLVALDLWSKAWAFAEKAPDRFAKPGFDWLDLGFVEVRLVNWWNTGTIWGLFQDYTAVLIGARLLTLGVLLWFLATAGRAQRMMHLVLGLLFSGAVGNLYDNFTQKAVEPGGADGGVRDFIYFVVYDDAGQRVWDFPAFNIADSCVTVGAIGLILLLWFGPDSRTSGKG